METNDPLFGSKENQSQEVIRRMIQASKKVLTSDHILFLIWGYAMTIGYLSHYLNEILFVPNRIHSLLKFVELALGIIAICFTIFYFVKIKRKVISHNSLSIVFVWVAMSISLSLTNVILFSKLHKVDFTLQHPIFMVIIAFAIVITGIIDRFKLVIIGGVVFAALAYICCFFELNNQMLLEAIGWFIALVIPGHLLYFKKSH
jgi:hypothetical protein